MTVGVPPPPQDLAVATFRGWGQVAETWYEAAENWWLTIVEWAYDECAYLGVNQTAAYAVVADTAPLYGEFYRATDAAKTLIPSSRVKIGRTTHQALATTGAPSTPAPTAAAAGAPVLLVVSILPAGIVPPGGYRGRVVDASTKRRVADNLYIYVATTT